MTVYISADAKNLREELASLRNQGGYQEQQFYFDGLVTNGTFDSDTAWTKGTGWTISGGVATKSAGTASSLSQGDLVKTGSVYVVQYTLSSYSGGGVQIILDGVAGSPFRTVNGTYTEIITASGGSGIVYVYGNSLFAGSIDNISVFEVDASNDVIHTMPKGWKPKDVFEDGLLQREGAAHDYEVVYDGFDYYVKPTVAPSATTQTCVIGVKA